LFVKKYDGKNKMGTINFALRLQKKKWWTNYKRFVYLCLERKINPLNKAVRLQENEKREKINLNKNIKELKYHTYSIQVHSLFIDPNLKKNSFVCVFVIISNSFICKN